MNGRTIRTEPSVIYKGPLCRSREGGFPLEPFTAGSCRVVGETSTLEVTQVDYVNIFVPFICFFVECSTFVCSLLVIAAKGKLITYMVEISCDVT